MGPIDKNRKLALDRLNLFLRNRTSVNLSSGAGYETLTGGGHTRTDNDVLSTDPSLLMLLDLLEDIHNEELQEQEEENGFLSNAVTLAANAAKVAISLNNRKLDIARLLTQKAAESILNSNEHDRDESNLELQQIETIRNYKNACNEIEQLKTSILKQTGGDPYIMSNFDSYVKSVADGSVFANPQLEAACKRYVELDDTIRNLDNYFKTEGRQYWTVRNEMFSSDDASAFDKTRIALSNINQGTKRTGNIIDAAGNLVGGPLGWIGALHDVITGNAKNTAISRLDDGDPLIDRLYKGRNVSKEDDTTLKNNEDYYKRLLNQYDMKIKADLEFYREGVLHPSVIAKSLPVVGESVFGDLNQSDIEGGKGIGGVEWNKYKVYNPEDIDEQYKKEQQENNWKVWRPDYWIPEVGSSLGLGVGMVGTAASGGLTNFVMKKLPVWLNPQSKLLTAAQGTLLATEAANSVMLTRMSRQMETGGEASTALASRVIGELQKDGQQYTAVMSDITDQLKKFGIDTSGLTPEHIFNLAIAYNVKSENTKFNYELDAARKGLTKLINANNSLAYSDYIESLPFTSFGGSFFRALGNSLSKGAEKLVSSRGYRLLASKDAAEFETRTAQDVAMQGMRGLQNATGRTFGPANAGVASVGKVLDDITLPLVNKFKPETTAVFDNIIERAAKKALEKSAVTALRKKHVGEYLQKTARNMAGIGLTEGIEEANQEILQRKYGRGEYDNYREPYSMFNIPEVFQDVVLSGEAMSDLLGVNFGSPDNGSPDIRRAFAVGVLASMGIPAGGNVVSNLTGANENNVRGLIRQLKADKAAGEMLDYDNLTIKNLIKEMKDDKVTLKMVGDALGGDQDQQRLGIFFDAMHRGKATKQTLAKALNDYESLIDNNDLVSKQFILDDRVLLNSMDIMYNSDWINDQVKKSGWKKFGTEHRDIAIQGARYLAETAKDEEMMNEERVNAVTHRRVLNDLINQLKDIEDQLASIANDGTLQSAEKRAALAQLRSDLLQNNATLKGLHELAVKLYGPAKEGYTSRLLNDFDEFVKNPTIKKAIEGRQGNKLDGKEFYREFNDVAKELFGDEESKKKLVELATSEGRVRDQWSFLEEFASLYHDYIEMKVAEEVLGVTKDQEQLQTLFRKITGLGINTKKLKGINKIMSTIVDKIKKSNDDYVAKHLSGYKSLDELFEGIEEFNDAKEHRANLMSYFLNSAAYEAQATVRNAYLTGTSMYGRSVKAPDADVLELALFGEDEGNSVVSEYVKNFKKLNKEYKEKLEEERRTTDLHDIQKVNEQAAWAIIKDNLKNFEKNKRIAHRIYEEERPINAQDVDNATNGDPVATEKITGTKPEQPQQQDQPQPLQNPGKKTWGGVSIDTDVRHEESEASKRSRKLIEGANLAAEAAREAAERLARERQTPSEQATEQHNAEQNEKVSLKQDELERKSEQPVNNPAPAPVVNPEQKAGDPEQSAQPQVSTEQQLPEPQVEQQQNPEPVPTRSEETPTLTQDPDDALLTVPESEEQNEATVVTDEQLEKEKAAEAEAELLILSAAKEDKERLANEQFAEESMNNGINPDSLDIDDEGKLTVDGMIVNQTVANEIQAELSLLLAADKYDSIIPHSEIGVDNSKSKEKELGTSKRAAADYVSQTFFYDPSAKDVINLAINGKTIQLEHPLAPNSQLAKNLLQEGWFENAKKYYVVTQSLAAQNNPNDADSFTVAMIIDDGKNSYAVTLRQLGVIESKDNDGKTYFKNHEQKLRAWLSKLGTKYENLSTEEAHQKLFEIEKEIAQDVYAVSRKPRPNTVVDTNGVETSASIAAQIEWKRQAASWYTTAPSRSDYHSEKAYEKDLDTWKQAVKRIKADARKRAQQPYKSIMTDEQIDDLINKLRELRNKIIDTVLTKNGDQYIFPSTDKAYPQTAKPQFATRSNGVINNVKNDAGVPVFRSVAEGSIEEVTRKINSGELVFGIGLGYFSKTAPGQFKIRELGDTGIEFEGKGLSGKVYMMVPGRDGYGNKKMIPIMLTESRFDVQEREFEEDGKTRKESSHIRPEYPGRKSNVRLSLDPATCLRTDTKYKPSAAEVLLYLICGKTPANDKFFGTQMNNIRLASILSSMFINHGEMTLLHSKNRKSKKLLAPFAQKQIAWYQKEGSRQFTFAIAMPNGSNDEYEVREFSEEDLFGYTEQATENRRAVVAAIATQMHWNTEESHMTSNFGSEQFKPFIDALYNYFKENDVDSVSIFDCPQLTFNRDDFFNENMDLKSNLSMLAWMIKTGRIVTDTAKDIFKDPFVFANGVTQSESSQNLGEMKQAANVAKDSETVSVVEAVGNSLAEDTQKKVENLKGVSKDFNLVAENEKQKVLDFYRKRPATSDVKEVLAVDISEAGLVSTDIIKAIKDKVEKYAEKHGIKTVNYESLEVDGEPSNAVKQVLARGKGYPVVYVFDDHCQVLVQSTGNLNIKTIKAGVTGVFSKTRGNGEFNERKARKWLRKTLGLTGANVIVENAIFKSASSGEEVYGLVNLSLNALNDLSADIRLSSKAGKGVHYHEAWHYVNLLMHDANERAILYKEYEDLHPELKGKMYKEIEEAMAEDFRAYMEMRTSYTPSSIINRLWDDIKTLIGVASNKSAYRYVYKQIRNGRYAGQKLNDKSVKEFAKKYPKGALMEGYIPNLDKHTTEQLDMPSYHDFYDIAYAIVNYIIDYYDIDSIDTLRSVSGRGFKETLNLVKQFAEQQSDPSLYDSIMSVYNNPLALQKILLLQFAKYGINVKVKSFKNNNVEDDDEAHQFEEGASDNQYDKFDLSISGKDNVALKAKMFMSRIPVLKPVRVEYRENGVTKYKTEYEPDLDPFGNPKMYSFSEVWVASSQMLHNTDSFDKTDKEGHYLPNSTLGMCEKFGRANPMFMSMLEKLKQVVDKDSFNIQLKQCLQATMNRSMANVQYIQLSDPKQMAKMNEADLMANIMYGNGNQNNAYAKAADRERLFDLFNDNRLHIARNIPRRWSRNAILKGIVKNSNGVQVVNDEFAKELVSILGYTVKSDKNGQYSLDTSSIANDSLMYHVAALKPKKGVVLSDTEKMQHIDRINQEFVKLLNAMGIDADEYSVNTFVNSFTKEDSQSADNLSNIYQTIFRTTGSKKGGNIIQTINLIVKSIGKLALDTGEEEGKPIEDVYNRYGLNTDIARLALAWNATYPSSQEFSLPGPNGDMLYPVSQNNFISDIVRWLNNEEGKSNDPRAKASEQSYAAHLRKSDYCRNSIILRQAVLFDQNTDNDSKLKLFALVGLKDTDNNKGADYFGITTLEDYLIKMCILESDHWTKSDWKKNSKGQPVDKIGQLLCPTMADKKTYYSFGCKGLTLSHDSVVTSVPKKYIDAAKNDLFYLSETYINNYKEIDDLSLVKKNNYIYDWTKEQSENPEFNKKVNDLALEMYIKEHGQLKRFSDTTLNRFVGYFEDELRSLISYYSKENIAKLVKDSSEHVENFHGSIKNGRLQFNGNGGKFRYFFDTFLTQDLNGTTYNMNQYMQYLFNLQKDIENGKVKNPNFVEGDPIESLGTGVIGEDPNNLDGFELIRAYLNNLRDQYLGSRYTGGDRATLRNLINRSIISLVDSELDTLSRNPALTCVKKEFGGYTPYAIPKQFLQNYADDFERQGISPSGDIYAGNGWIEQNALYSLIANHVVNTITSMVEYEKIYSGDPALYKWKGIRGDNSTVTISQEHTFEDGTTIVYETQVDNIYDKFSDKIKRFGGQLSPGDEVSLFYNENEIQLDLESERPSYLNCTKYTNLHLEDLNAMSVFIDELRHNFLVQTTVDKIRSSNIPEFEKYAKSKIDDAKSKNKTLTKENVISLLYSKDAEFERVFKLLPKKVKDDIEDIVESQIDPYTDITVADAQVMVRPSMYRKIRIGLGEWTFEEDEYGYSDEKAYNILENDASWMDDPEKSAIVRKFQVYPLKMSYFQNDPAVRGAQNINLAAYNKMAIFPVFKFNSTSELARKVYDRMNKPQNELDMISFKSAVKVGAIDDATSPIEKDKFGEFCYIQSHAYGKSISETRKALVKFFKKKGFSEDAATKKASEYTDSQIKEAINSYKESIPSQLSSVNEAIFKDSNWRINYKDGTVSRSTSKNTLPVMVLDLKFLRMQLNTKAHEATERAIGTQMFKIAFSNIIDKATYCEGKDDRNVRTGAVIKNDIMSCINALTYLGARSIYDEYYTTTRRGRVPNNGAIKKWIQRVILNNGIGTSAEEIIANGGVIASLMSRKLFEQTVSSAVNREVVNINTNGGTAIQQSSFGFAGFGNASVQTQGTGVDYKGNRFEGNDYKEYNGGEELKWNTENGSMEVILSMNFFKPVVPVEYQTTPNKMKQWLIDNDIIKGVKTDGTKANPKPFGVGYRIPTQGMSSMFGFTVADVLPEQSGDVIIVPREFTAQTGSDFDVDKLFLATTSYIDGKLPTWKTGEAEALASNEEYMMTLTKEQYDEYVENYVRKHLGFNIPKSETDINNMSGKELRRFLQRLSPEYIQNRLIQNYIDIITDRKNYGMARASIDVFTNKIKDELLKYVQDQPVSYIHGFFDLTPSFQAIKKLEFSTGKDGIGPFALNITHLALTLFTHLTLDYSKNGNPYNFGRLDEIQGEDGLSIAGWLSAMVNAHVDVAKDPYVFAINVNKETYNHANFLIRAGKGLSTFTFLAQPILKKYATQVALSKSIYGSNIEGKTPEGGISDINAKQIKKKLVAECLDQLVKMYEKPEVLHELTKEDKEFFIVTKNFFSKKDENKVEKPDLKKINVFDKDLAIASIEGWSPKATFMLRYKSALFQLYAMYAYTYIDDYAQKLADLVHLSQIDTKKFGNDITTQLNFKNSLNVFIKTSTGWIMEDKTTKDTLWLPDEAALTKYFKELYLGDKLYYATKITREILKDWTFTATNEYANLFDATCRVMFGEEVVTTKDAKTKKTNTSVIGYKSIKKEDTVTAIGNGLDNTMRFNALMLFGYDAFKRNGGLKQKENEGMIDFTCGGDKQKLINKIRELFNGDPKHGNLNIIERLFNFTNMIKNKNSKYSEGLINDEGEIINEVLKYFIPMPGNQYDPIGRITLLTSQMNMDLDKKSILMSAMYELLTHPEEKVRELARDLVLYGYYSTYDQNTRDAFLDIVPYEFRKQYDLSLKQGINASNRGENIKDDILKGGELSRAQLYLATMVRNYWYDDEIVPRFFESRRTQNILSPTGGEVHIAKMNIDDSKYTFPGAILSSYARTGGRIGPKYFKIRKGNVTVLYKKVATIPVGDKTKYSVYMAIPKAGIHQGHIKQFEMYADYTTPSIFKLNRLPENWAPSVLLQQIRGVIQNSVKQLNEKKTDEQDKIKIEDLTELNMFEQDLNSSYSSYRLANENGSLNESMYYETKSQNTAYDGIVRLNGLNKNEDVIEKAVKVSDVVIEMDSTEVRSKSQNAADKTVSVKYGDVENIADEVARVAARKLLPEKDLSKAPASVAAQLSQVYSSGISLYITGDSEKVSVTKKEIDDYVQTETEKFIAEIKGNPQDKERVIEDYRQLMQQKAESVIRQQKVDDYVLNIVYTLLMSGTKINLLNTTTYEDEYMTLAVIKAAKLVQNYLIYKNATVYAMKDDFRTGVSDELYDILRYGNDDLDNQDDEYRQAFIDKMNDVQMSYSQIIDAIRNAKNVLQEAVSLMTPSENMLNEAKEKVEKQAVENILKQATENKPAAQSMFSSMFNPDANLEQDAQAAKAQEEQKALAEPETKLELKPTTPASLFGSAYNPNSNIVTQAQQAIKEGKQKSKEC